MRKLLWHSNAPWSPTGYGQQTALFGPHLAEHYDLAISAFYGLEGARLTWRGIPVFPGVGQDWGNAYILEHAKAHLGSESDGLVLTLMDVWVLDRALWSKLNVASWVPVDHDPIPFQVANFFKASGAVPIAMSRFGEEQLRRVDLEPLYVPHGVDTNVFRPHDRDEIRRSIGCPTDAFLIGMVAANNGTPSRKGFQQAFEAFRIFHDKHDDALLYLHTVVDPAYASGEDLMTMARALGIAEHLVIAPSYQLMYDPMPPEQMARVYSMLDVLLNPSMGEGFGVPILEAAACGVPSIVTNHTAMPEVAGPAGWVVGCYPFWSSAKSWWGIAEVAEIVDALEARYGESEGECLLRAQQARDHALEYDVKKVLEERFLPALETVHERLGQHGQSVSREQLTKAA